MRGKLAAIDLAHVALIVLCFGLTPFSWTLEQSPMMIFGEFTAVAPLLLWGMVAGVFAGVADDYAAPPKAGPDVVFVVGSVFALFALASLLAPFIAPDYASALGSTTEVLCAGLSVFLLTYGYVRRIVAHGGGAGSLSRQSLFLGQPALGIALLLLLGCTFTCGWTVLSIGKQTALAYGSLSTPAYVLALTLCLGVGGVLVHGIPRWGMMAPLYAAALFGGSVIAERVYGSWGDRLSFADGVALLGASALCALLLLLLGPFHGREARERPDIEKKAPLGSLEISEDLGRLLETLSERERDATRRALAGATSSQIAEATGVKPSTVRSHLQRAYKKLGVSSLDELRARVELGSKAHVVAGSAEVVEGAAAGDVVAKPGDPLFELNSAKDLAALLRSVKALLSLVAPVLVLYLAYGTPLVPLFLPAREMLLGGMVGALIVSMGSLQLNLVAPDARCAQGSGAEPLQFIAPLSGYLRRHAWCLMLPAVIIFIAVCDICGSSGSRLDEGTRSMAALIASALLSTMTCTALFLALLDRERSSNSVSADSTHGTAEVRASDLRQPAQNGSAAFLDRLRTAVFISSGYICLGVLWCDAWFGDLDVLSVLIKAFAVGGCCLLLLWALRRSYGPDWDRGYFNIIVVATIVETVIEYANPHARMYGTGLIFCLACGLVFVGSASTGRGLVDGFAALEPVRFVPSVFGIALGALMYEAVEAFVSANSFILKTVQDYAAWGATSMLLWAAMLVPSALALYRHLCAVLDEGQGDVTIRIMTRGTSASGPAGLAGESGSVSGVSGAPLGDAANNGISRARHYLLSCGLSERDAAVLELVYSGLTGATIAKRLFLSLGSVNAARMSGYRHLGIHTRQDLVLLINSADKTAGR